MPQTVKIQTGFSEKTSENYNSTQHSISLEMDCNINGSTHEIEEASQKLFALCRKIVSVQKSVNVDSLLNNDMPATPAPAVPPPATNNNTTTVRLASQKQITFLLQLAKKSNLTHDEILSLPKSYNQTRFEDLSAQEASALIDRFNHKKAA
jgi:hypothetical protein